MSYRTTQAKRDQSMRIRNRHRKGAIVALMAIALPLLLLIAGFGLYIASAQLVRTELRTSVDFAARAGAKKLSLDQSESSAIDAARDLATRNQILGSPLVLNAGDIQVGESRQNGGPLSRFEFNSGGSRKNSVQVNGTAEGDSGITGFFGSLAGINNSQFNLASTATNLDRDICVVIDRSGSMAEPVNSSNRGQLGTCGPLPNDCRFAALARAIDVFVQELDTSPQQNQVSLASYSSPVRIECRCCVEENNPCNGISRNCSGELRSVIQFDEATIHTTLSTNSASLRGPIQQMLNNGIGGATAIGSGLTAGLNAVEGSGSRPFAFPTIVLMTDGNHNRGISPVAIANRARNSGVVVHTITFSPGANQALMRRVASITGGIHLHADDEASLNDAFREIANTLPVMLTN